VENIPRNKAPGSRVACEKLVRESGPSANSGAGDERMCRIAITPAANPTAISPIAIVCADPGIDER